MKLKKLSKWLKCVLSGFGISGLILCIIVIPAFGLSLRTLYPEFSNRFWPWLIFLLSSSIFYFALIVMAWKIATNIGHNQSFSIINARLLKQMSILSLAASLFFFIGNNVIFLLNMSHPSILLASLVIVFTGIAVSVIFNVLSHLVKIAAELQEQSDWTI